MFGMLSPGKSFATEIASVGFGFVRMGPDVKMKMEAVSKDELTTIKNSNHKKSPANAVFSQ